MTAPAPTPGFHPPVADNGLGIIDVPYLDGPMVAAGTLAADGTPFITDPLPRGTYQIWTSDEAWILAGPGITALDGTLTSASDPVALARRPKSHDGGQAAWAIRDGSSIGLKAKGSAPVAFEIYEVN